MTSTTVQDAQSQLNGLVSFCAKNRPIVDTVKTKCMAFGKLEHVKLCFNGHALDQVMEYKYFGNIVRIVSKPINDICANNCVTKPVAVFFQSLRSLRTPNYPYLYLIVSSEQ